MGNPVPDGGNLASTISIYSTTTDDLHPVGTRATLRDDDRVFRWCHNNSGATLTAGELLVTAAVDANINMTLASSAVNQNVLTFTGLAVAAADLYRDGYALITDGTEQGITFKIREHGAIAVAASQTVTLYDNLPVAQGDGSETLTLLRHDYDSPQQSNTAVAEVPVGVCQVDIADASRGWLQTWGTAAVLTAGTPAIGVPVTISTGTAGAVMIMEQTTIADLADQPHIGYMRTVGVDTEFQGVDLRIKP